MQEVLKWVGIVGAVWRAVWLAVSFPVALIVGRVLKCLKHDPPQPLRLVSDEQAGEQR